MGKTNRGNTQPHPADPALRGTPGDLLTLTRALLEVTRALEGRRLANKIESQVANGGFLKLFRHATTLLDVVKEGGKHAKELLGVTAPDFPSAMALARAVAENHAVLYHTLLSPADPQERELRALYLARRGLKERQRYTAVDPQHVQKLAQEKDDIRRLEQEIRAHPWFEKLPPEYRKAGLKDPYYKISREVKTAGFGEKTYGQRYSLMSQHAHTGYLSLLQTGQAQRDTAERFARLACQFACEALALTVRYAVKRYGLDPARFNPYRERVFFHAKSARGEDRWAYKALYQDADGFNVAHWEREVKAQAGERQVVHTLRGLEPHPDRAGAEQAYRALPHDEGELPAEALGLAPARQVFLWG